VPAMGFTAFAGWASAFAYLPTRSPRCTSLRRFAPRRQPCRLSTVNCSSWRFERTRGVDRMPFARRSAFARRMLSHLPSPPSPRGHRCSRPRCFHCGRLQPHLASPRGLLPPRGPDLGWPSCSMRTGSAMTLGLPPSHRSVPASTP
jgi:hypothetical protein